MLGASLHGGFESGWLFSYPRDRCFSKHIEVPQDAAAGTAQSLDGHLKAAQTQESIICCGTTGRGNSEGTVRTVNVTSSVKPPYFISATSSLEISSYIPHLDRSWALKESGRAWMRSFRLNEEESVTNFKAVIHTYLWKAVSFFRVDKISLFLTSSATKTAPYTGERDTAVTGV